MAGGKIAGNYAVVHDRLISRGGSERVATAIAKALDATLYTARYEPERTLKHAEILASRTWEGSLSPKFLSFTFNKDVRCRKIFGAGGAL